MDHLMKFDERNSFHRQGRGNSSLLPRGSRSGENAGRNENVNVKTLARKTTRTARKREVRPSVLSSPFFAFTTLLIIFHSLQSLSPWVKYSIKFRTGNGFQELHGGTPTFTE